MLTTVNLFCTNGQRFTPIEPKMAAVEKNKSSDKAAHDQSDLETKHSSRLFILPYLSSRKETKKYGEMKGLSESSSQLKKAIAQPEIDSEALPRVLEWCEKVNPVGGRVAYPPSLTLSVPKSSAV